MPKNAMSLIRPLIIVIGLLIVPLAFTSMAKEFTQDDLDRRQQEFMSVVQEGDALFHDPGLGTNGVSCDQCHPNAANTHPETYPKFQQQIGKVVSLAEMVNWCLENPLEGEPLKLDSPEMTALLSYISYERRGVPLAPGKH